MVEWRTKSLLSANHTLNVSSVVCVRARAFEITSHLLLIHDGLLVVFWQCSFGISYILLIISPRSRYKLAFLSDTVVSFPSTQVSRTTLALKQRLMCSIYPGSTVTGEVSSHHTLISYTGFQTQITQRLSATGPSIILQVLAHYRVSLRVEHSSV